MSKVRERILFVILGCVLGIVMTLALLVVSAFVQSRTPAAAIIYTKVSLVCYKQAMTNFFATTGRWPASETELVSNSMHIIFIDPSPPVLDGWGRPIVYEPYATNRGYGRVFSYGRDGKPGGSDADADIELKFP